jgi:hypothetical protein
MVYGMQPYKENVTVTTPFDATVTMAWQYLVSGVYQFGVNAISPCGIMLRVGHLHTASPLFAKILSGLPPAAENDSRKSWVSVQVKKELLWQPTSEYQREHQKTFEPS